MIRLIRNLETNRNKEQEDSFNVSLNNSLYFDINKTIEKIDGWKLAHVKRLVEAVQSTEVDLMIEYVLWNKNVDFIFNSPLKVEVITPEELDPSIIDTFAKGDIEGIHNYLKQIKEDKNKKLLVLLLIAELVGDTDSLLFANKAINYGLPSIDVAIDTIMPKLLLREVK